MDVFLFFVLLRDTRLSHPLSQCFFQLLTFHYLCGSDDQITSFLCPEKCIILYFVFYPLVLWLFVENRCSFSSRQAGSIVFIFSWANVTVETVLRRRTAPVVSANAPTVLSHEGLCALKTNLELWQSMGQNAEIVRNLGPNSYSVPATMTHIYVTNQSEYSMKWHRIHGQTQHGNHP